MFAAKDRHSETQWPVPAPAPLAASARISSNLRQESQMPPFPLRRTASLAKASVFSSLRALLPAQRSQHSYFHSLPHSLKNAQDITPAFSITPALFLRSCARVQYSTPLFS